MNHKQLHVKGKGQLFPMPFRNRHILWISTFLMWLPALALADQLEIASGERFDGSLVNIRSGTLSFRTALAGRIFVPVDEVRAIRTAAFVAVTLDREKLLPGRIETVGGEFYIMNLDGRDKTPLPLERVSQVDRIPESEQPRVEGGRSGSKSVPRFTAESGYRVRLGSEDSSGAYARIGVEGETPQFRFNLLGDLEYTFDESALDRYYRFQGGVGMLRDAISPEVQVELERDTNRALEHRSEFVAGARTTLVKDSEQTLSGFAGLGVTLEDWNPRKLRSDQGIAPPLPGDSSRDDEDLNLNLQLHYSRQMPYETTLTQQLRVLPGLTDDDFRASLESQLSVPLSLQFQLRFGLLLDYDNTSPFQRVDDWSAAMEAGLSIDF